MTLHGYPCEFQWMVQIKDFYISEQDILRELESVYSVDVFTDYIKKHQDKHVDRHRKCLCRGSWFFIIKFSAENSTPTECKFHITLMGHERRGNCFESCGKYKISRKVTYYGTLCSVIKELYIFTNNNVPLYMLFEILDDEFKPFTSFEIYQILKNYKE